MLYKILKELIKYIYDDIESACVHQLINGSMWIAHFFYDCIYSVVTHTYAHAEANTQEILFNL